VCVPVFPGVCTNDTTYDRQWLLSDERGSIITITDDAGDIVDNDGDSFDDINTYDEYGRPGSDNVGRFQYAGRIYLPVAGLYNNRARVYDPGTGRFLQTDPIGQAGGLNIYAYTGADPVNFTDPSGLAPCFDVNNCGMPLITVQRGSNGQLFLVSSPVSNGGIGQVPDENMPLGVYSLRMIIQSVSAIGTYCNNVRRVAAAAGWAGRNGGTIQLLGVGVSIIGLGIASTGPAGAIPGGITGIAGLSITAAGLIMEEGGPIVESIANWELTNGLCQQTRLRGTMT
jgi:RHS repeat-associated protein